MSDGEAIRCTNCGFPVEAAEQLQNLLAEAREGIGLLNDDLMGKRMAIARLRGEIGSRLETNKHYSEAAEVLEYYGEKLQPKARELLSDERLKVVLARLNKKHTVEGLKLCVDGYVRFPYIVNGKRSSQGTASQRYVKATLIFRDAQHVEEGIELARRPVESVSAASETTDIRFIDWRKVRFANHRAIVAALRKAQAVEYDERTRIHETECPRCQRVLMIYPPDEAQDSLLRCYGCNLTEAIFFSALKDTNLPPAVDEKTIQALDVLEDMSRRLEAMPS